MWNKISVLVCKDLKSLFYSPIAYALGAIFSLLNGYTFWIIINILNNPNGEISENIIQLFFGGTIFFWIGLLIIIPIITMRSFSEEKKSGTIELLFTAPISDIQIVLSKFIGIFLFYIILWIPTILYILYIKQFGQIDFRVLCSVYFGTFLIGAVMISFGLLFSSITKNQIIAAVLCFFVLLALFSVGFISIFIKESFLSKFIDYIWLIGHFEDFSKGLIDLKRIVYYCSLVFFNIYLTVQVIQLRIRN